MAADAVSVRDLLRAAVVVAMKQRDRAALAVYRTALGAIDNAEAVPLADSDRAGAIELSPVGPGRADVQRRLLTEPDMVDIVTQEANARCVDADLLASGNPDAAQRLRHEADLLKSLIRRAAGGRADHEVRPP